MSWQERQYRDQEPEGAFRRAMRRIFADPSNFFSWSIPLFRFSRIVVRLHIFFLLYIVTTLLWSIGDRTDFINSAMSMGVLFTIVLLHEFGHCFACRWVGGEANEIVMWPLGGLAMCHPPRTWRANLITTVGGPMVNVILVPLLALLLLGMGAPAHALWFNPLVPGNVLSTAWFSSPLNYLRIGVWWAYYVNLALLAFNVLLPMFPLDGGRIVQEILWARQGYRRSMMTATLIGLVGAVTLGLFALTARGQGTSSSSGNLLGIAIFSGLTCWSERRRVAMMDEFDSAYEDAFEAQQRRLERDAHERTARRETRSVESEATRQAEVDRILTKIREQGMASLTRREQATLRGETERKRRAL